MTSRHTKIALAAAWAACAAIIVLVGTGQVPSNTDRIALALVGSMAPLALWFWWNEPAQTMSESIHAVRDEARSAARQRPGRSREDGSDVQLR